MNNSQRYDELSDDQLHGVDFACGIFERALRSDAPVTIESQLETVPAAIRTALFRELLAVELEWRLARERFPDIAEYLARFPTLDEDVRLVFFETKRLSDPAPTVTVLHSGKIAIAPDPSVAEHPQRIGRYKLEQIVGSGSFGVVYRAHDEQLDRVVALKVPHQNLVSRREDAAAYLAEAQNVARLDHPNIVPVYDFGSSDEVLCYIVSKYVDGSSLSTRLKAGRLHYRAAVNLVAAIAEALHAAHRQGLVHRDVKPGNILIDPEGRAYLADFGLALREENIGRELKYAGTPAYMSPEQARGEEHRVDGRSDIFSLGAVFYELLTGRQPFRAATHVELLHRVATYEPRPPRQYDEQIPKVLERMCMKALAKRASDRYATAHDLAEDLRQFLAEESLQASSTPGRLLDASPVLTSAKGGRLETPSVESSSPGLGSDSRPLKVLPKGLSSYDEHDADFFLELLPGPRDRSGLPDSVRFWKTRIEERAADKTFAVGLIYGPSGCGKSSLVKAGLLPCLSSAVMVVYVEATVEDTETRLLRGIRQRLPGLPQDLDLATTLTALRREESGIPSQRLLIVLDQFEQWLHAKREEHDTELVRALRQCDGAQVQCIVMVRDDFWLAVSRFMHDLEIDLVPGRNVALVDLFDLDHARTVLAAFGRAFGKLPEQVKETTKQQRDFLKQSILGLAEAGKVVPVRLSLFAEMMKSKSWTSAALKEMGGAEGAGVTFLEEMFRARTANPQHRFHQEAAQQVLRALLPDSSSNIKGKMRSYDELLQASGYGTRTEDFDDLIRILDSESRLITPTERDRGADVNLSVTHHSPHATQYYQLTHDYLVPVLRKWLTAGQKATRRGRAELRLAERAVAWNAKPENRYLPAWWEYVNIRLFTRWHQWTEPQRQMMRKAQLVHGMRWGTVLLVTILIAIASQQSASRTRRRQLNEQTKVAVAAMRNSLAGVVPHAIADLEALPVATVIEELRTRFDDSSESQQLPLAYALAHFGEVDVNFLVAQIPRAAAGEVENFVTALGRSKSAALSALHQAAAETESAKDWLAKQRLAMVAMRLGDTSLAAEMCRLGPDPIQRSIFIEQTASWRGDDQQLVDCAPTIVDSALRSGLALGIGSTPADRLTSEMLLTWQPVFSDWYLNHADTGTHSAAGWVLQHWGRKLPAIASTRQPERGHDWYLNSQGMTLLKIPAGSFVRQTPETGIEVPPTSQMDQRVILSRRFFLADREISIGMLQQFLDELPADETLKELTPWKHPDPYLVLGDKHPAYGISWYTSVKFCNWLSLREGLPLCYERTGQKEEIRTYPYDEWQLVAGATGYRLPTEAEWEYSCRAGTTTLFPSGDDNSRMLSYAVVRSPMPAIGGTKLPNGWGLFDMIGNVSEWCQDCSDDYGSEPTITDPIGPVHRLRRDGTLGEFRTIRGGIYSFVLDVNLHSSHRSAGHPDEYRGNTVGFRVARDAVER